ncbi:Metallo-dependent hydrolase [Hysterangium stoloniferum]|nr:Metallo-dependent hydrolase [Hysterangium stoloniferum]
MSSNALVCFTNCRLVLEDGSLVDRDLWIDEARGVILDAQKTFFAERRRPDTTIDLKGNIISPGFIDAQINGAYGFDFSIFSDGDEKAYDEGLRMIAKRIVETGVTSTLNPCFRDSNFSSSPLNYGDFSSSPRLSAVSHPDSATLLGWHAEGPFLQPEKRGAHMQGFLLTAPEGIKTFSEVYGEEALCQADQFVGKRGNTTFPGVRVITAAPEIEGVIPAIEELSRRGVICAIGHSTASSNKAREAATKGARLITHLFNAMPQLHHRDPSIIGLLGASPTLAASSQNLTYIVPSPPFFLIICSGVDSTVVAASNPVSEAFSDVSTPPTPPLYPVNSQKKNIEGLALQKVKVSAFHKPYYGIIVDGCHSHPHSVRLAYTAHKEGCILVTDAMPMLDPHLCDGLHDWRDNRRLVKEGVKLYIEGTDILAGSVVTLDTCVRNFVEFTGCTLGEAIKCATYNPAVCLNIANRKGTLRAGADADLVVLDPAGNVKATWVAGKKVWSAEK